LDKQLRESPLWPILVETTHSLPLFKQHKNYIKENLLPKTPGITPEEISQRLAISLGEALVLIEELTEKT
jgi:hypothetical protein